MLQSTPLENFVLEIQTSMTIVRVIRLYPPPSLNFTHSPVNYIQSLGIKLSSLKELLSTGQIFNHTYNGSQVAHSDSITYYHPLDTYYHPLDCTYNTVL
jgi:hypothetical protein